MTKRKEKPQQLTPSEMGKRGQKLVRKRLGKRAYLKRLREMARKGGIAKARNRRQKP